MEEKEPFNRYRLNDLLTGKDRKMNKLQLAEKMGVTPQTISRWINGQGLPSPEKMHRICEILGVEKDFDLPHLSHTYEGEKVDENFYIRRINELVANQPEYIQSRILTVVIQEINIMEQLETGVPAKKKMRSVNLNQEDVSRRTGQDPAHVTHADEPAMSDLSGDPELPEALGLNDRQKKLLGDFAERVRAHKLQESQQSQSASRTG